MPIEDTCVRSHARRSARRWPARRRPPTQPFVDVGKQEPITILTPSTPWLPAFTKIVGLYEEQTGNKIKLDVNPFGGVLDKARNDLRSGGGTYDVVLLDTQWTIEMYEGGFLAPFKEIEPSFDRAEGGAARTTTPATGTSRSAGARRTAAS